MNTAELSKMYDFTGRTVVVTGGTGVLGQAMVRALVGCGANVALLARNREKAEPQVAALPAENASGRAMVFTADVLDAAALRAAAEEVVGRNVTENLYDRHIKPLFIGAEAAAGVGAD